jgi:hypothetical protein
MIRLCVWQSPTGAWLATCPSLEAGSRGPTRRKALDELRREIAREAEMLFSGSLEVFDSPPPAMEEA